MKNLVTIADSINIGNAAISTLSDLVSGRDFGRGLFIDTTIKGLRKYNMINNYHYTSSYYNIKSKTKPSESKRYFYGRLLDAPNIDGLEIGWAYTTDMNKHSLNVGFVSSSDFEIFQDLLRERVLFYKEYDETYNRKIKSTHSKMYSNGNVIDTPNTPTLELGQTYSVDIVNPIYERSYKSEYFDVFQKNLRDSLLSKRRGNLTYETLYLNNKEKFVNNDSSRVNWGDTYGIDDNIVLKPLKTIKDFTDDKIFKVNQSIHNANANFQFKKNLYKAKNTTFPLDGEVSTHVNDRYYDYTIRHELSRPKQDLDGVKFPTIYGFPNVAVKENYKLFNYYNGNYIINGSYISDSYDTDSLYSINDSGYPTYNHDITKEGLIDFYKKLRDERFNQIKSKRTTYWTYTSPYAIETNSKWSTYSIDDEYNRIDDISITKNKGGELHSALNGFTDKYYQEKDYSTNTFEIKNSSIIDGHSVNTISNIDSTSRLMQHTNKLFKSGKIKSLVNRFHTDAKDANNNELITSFDSTYGLSRGRNLLKKNSNGQVINDTSTGYSDPYCRVWTAHHQYSKLRDRIRPFIDDNKFQSLSDLHSKLGELRPNDGATRLNENSVLQSNGFIRMSPTYKKDGSFNNIKKYMFSLENLAWRDINKDELSTEQQGPNGGRIMWFPPYNLKFSENVQVNWNANNFIGRGEQIYTYTNTERSGTLDFTILIDHPSTLNKWRGQHDISGEDKEKREDEILRYFAGCGNLEGEIKSKKDRNDVIVSGNTIIPNETIITYGQKVHYIIFFPNDFSAIDYINGSNMLGAIAKVGEYETREVAQKDFSERDEAYKKEYLLEHNRKNPDSGKMLNNFDDDENTKNLIIETFFNNDENTDLRSLNALLQELSQAIKTEETVELKSIDIKGFASSHGKEINNIELCKRRRRFIKELISYLSSENGINIENITKFNELDGQIITVNKDGGRGDVNAIDAKLARAAIATFNYVWTETKPANTPIDGAESYNGQNLETPEQKNENKDERMQSTASTTTVEVLENDYKYDNEYLYFSEIGDNSLNHNLIHKYIVDKVKYFDPAFHSITPEGFNSRLTFLHQCTRQGPTTSVNSGNVNMGSKNYMKYAGNLAFGRAPYCILRIGDFFNTKICIDSMSIQYDNNGIQWDLNPEGVGVQPMYATITLNFKFLGGQDISGPVERLQNAVTSNYYANASIYDRHADYEGTTYNVSINKDYQKEE